MTDNTSSGLQFYHDLVQWYKVSRNEIKPQALYEKVKAGIYNVNLWFQRNKVWSNRNKARLIIRMFSRNGAYLDEIKIVQEPLTHIYNIADGKQRVSTIVDYMFGKLSLKTYYDIIDYNELNAITKSKFNSTGIGIADFGEQVLSVHLYYIRFNTNRYMVT